MMNFDERAYLTGNKHQTFSGEKDVAKLIFELKKDALRLTNGGVYREPGLMGPFVLVNIEEADRLGQVLQFIRTHDNFEFRYAIDVTKPVLIGQGNLGRATGRLNLLYRIPYSEKEEDRIEIAFWFDLANLFTSLNRIIKERKVLILAARPGNEREIMRADKLMVEFDNDGSLKPLADTLEDIAPYVSPVMRK